MVRLIALDFDFTLIDYQPGEKPHIEPEVLTYLGQLAASGLKVGIVTGRVFNGFADTLSSAGGHLGDAFPNYMLCNDSYLYEADDNGTFTEDKETNQRMRDENAARVTKMLPYMPQCIDRLKKGGVNYVGWSISSENGITFDTCSSEDAQKAIELIDGTIPDAHCARNCHLFHITPSGTGKGVSVLRYAQKLGIRPDEVLCIGDSLNDLTMLDGNHGFHSGTVANGDEQVKQAVLKNGGFVSDKRASRGAMDCIQQTIKEVCENVSH